VRRPAAPITVDEVWRLLTLGCRSAWEEALIVLLSTAGPRVSALCKIRVADVWNERTGAVRPRFEILGVAPPGGGTIGEKNSRHRLIVPRRALVRAIECLVFSGGRPGVWRTPGRVPTTSARFCSSTAPGGLRRRGTSETAWSRTVHFAR
jgi:hypothetical protein